MMAAGPNAAAVDALRGAGLKITAQRVAILNALHGDRSHPTAEAIHARLRDDNPSLSLSTVYSTLEAFVSAGLCRRVRSDSVRLRVDGIMSHHDHAVCSVCDAIFDVDRELFRMPSPPPELPGGLEVKAVRVEYDVICQTCRTTGAAMEKPVPRSHKPTQSKGGHNG